MNQSHFADERMAGSVPTWKHGDEAADRASSASSFASGQGGDLSAPAPRLSFGELLDVVNPLHHLPVVGGVYRSLTGDQLSSVARIAGGGLYGGPIGVATSLVSAAIEEHTGKDIVSNVMEAGEPTRYEFVEESRTAGRSRPQQQSEEVAVKNDVPLEIAAMPQEKPKPVSPKIDHVIDDLPVQKPITKVEIADIRPAKQVWNFNT